MGWLNRRRFLLLAGTGLAGLVGLRFALPPLMRPRWPRPLGDAAREFAEGCFAGLDRSRCWDGHVHLVGLGAGGSGCRVNPEMQSHFNPIRRLRYDVYTAALGLDNEATADADYVDRLLELHRLTNPQAKMVVLAFDERVDETGVARPEQSSFYVPNAYALEVARRHDAFVAGVSIHPYRPDAVERLEAAAESGARAVKWLPNAMGIDPASPLCDAFYRRLAELRLPLISHAGREWAVDSSDGQELGNPLRLRRALDAGVRVVVAHCASFGSSADLDAAHPAPVSSFRLLMRMFEQPRYEGLLFGDISGVTQVNRGGAPLRELLRARHLHPRLVNGSDYPIPAIRVLFSTWRLQLEGLIDDRQRRLCNELALANPLLFDFALKRSLTLREKGEAYRFADAVFETDWLFSPNGRADRQQA